MRRSVDVVWRAVDHVLVIARPGGEPIVVRGPAADVWTLLADDSDLDGLAGVLAHWYGAPIPVVRDDIAPLLDRLSEEGFVVDAD